ncbi:protein kinase [Streptosporangium sp. NPDC051022]|uniref:serine/threonine-protein kinase n=1 Tax=Streptosporangium sp. NPDC051022 TaxID=3155752 RepID=UPI003434210F
MIERKVAGRYRLLEPIGEGGMGVVWRSHDELLDRVVAIKEVRYRGVDEAARIDLNRRTIREAKTAGRLDHPSVIIVHDVVEEEGRPWIVMQLVRSRSLGEVVRGSGPLPPERVAAVGLHVLGALRAAHAAGVLHRDVKPENVLLADDGRVVLTDFGIASMTQETGITRTGGMVGTPAFLPPERLHGLPATPESDLWSLGATLYAALEGHPPFERPTAAATMMAVLNGEPSPMAHGGPLASAILGLMAREPSARMSADEAETLLTRAAAGHTPGGSEAAGRSPRAGSAPQPSRPQQTGAPAWRGGSPLDPPSPYAGQSPHTAQPHTAQPYSAQPHGAQPHAAQPYGGQPAADPRYTGNTGYGAEPGYGEGTRYPTDASHAAGAAGTAPAAWHPRQDGPAQALPPQDPAGFHRDAGPVYTGQPFQQNGPPPPGYHNNPAHHGNHTHPGQASHTNDPARTRYRNNPAQTTPQPYLDDPFQGGYLNDPFQAGMAASAQTGQPHHGVEPSYPGPRTQPGQHAAADEPSLTDRRPATRRIILMAGIPALALVIGAGGWLMLQSREGDQRQTPPSPTATAAVPDATATTGKPSKSPRPTATATGRPTKLPDGWQTYQDPLGFSVALPRGWMSKRFTGRDRVEFRAPGSSSLLWIESTEDPETDPVKHWEKVEKGGLAKKIWPGYERIGITPLRYRGVAAADWEFTYLKDKVPTHVLDRGFHTITGRPYAIYWESPEEEWDRTFFDRFAETFRP